MGIVMLFTMPDPSVNFPWWDPKEIEANTQTYASHYESDIQDAFEWVEEELTGMDFTLAVCSQQEGMPVEVWDKLHDRWREIRLLWMHITQYPYFTLEEDYAMYTTARMRDFFDEDAEWLQERPTNN
jgi:hypothetical protein